MSSDWTRTSGTPGTVTGLSFTGASNEDYAVWGSLVVDSSSSDGVDWTATVPSGATFEGITTDGLGGSDEAAPWDETTATTITGNSGVFAVAFSGVVDMAATGGTVGLQLALATPTGTLTVHKGSWMAYAPLT